VKAERVRKGEFIVDASGYPSMIAISFGFADAQIDGFLDAMADK
jgi:hypothetical protein